jgi:hypothetical protein
VLYRPLVGTTYQALPKESRPMVLSARARLGDAFQLPSQEFNYYRDFFLVRPLFLFTIAGLVNLFGVGQNYRPAIKCLRTSR